MTNDTNKPLSSLKVYGQPATRLTCQPNEYGKFSLYAWGIYPDHSVLAGQDCKQFVEMFDSIEELKSAYPEAVDSHPLLEPQNTFDHLPDTQDNGYFDNHDY